MFIRDEGTPQLRVYWRQFADNQPKESQPDPNELCPVSITQIKNYLGKDKYKAFVWDGLSENWKAVDSYTVYPGMTLLLQSDNGGYDQKLGFVADGNAVVIPLSQAKDVNDSFRGDPDSYKAIPILLKAHLEHVADAANNLLRDLPIANEAIAVATIIAASWHDVGKAHEVFQQTLTKDQNLDGVQLWAKSASKARHCRPYFRHELASMLAWLLHGEKSPTHDLIAYLIAAHHGKVRMSVRAMPDEKPPKKKNKRFARGVHDGDILPPVQIVDFILPETVLQLDVMELGESVAMGASWTARTQKLLAEHGPFQLAWYETLVRIADWRASEQEQSGGKIEVEMK